MESVMYKNRLQELAQKSGNQLPVYQTINDAVVHAPRFRSTVYVNGSYYQSATGFSNRKDAEKDAARVALESIPQKQKEETTFQFLSQDTSLCKSIINEYAVKMNFDKPTYATKQAQGTVSVFVSDILLNGVSFSGQRAKNKKEAEQLAARAAILSIMDSESKLAMSEIIRSKEKMYALLYGADVNLSGVRGNVKDNVGSGLECSLSKRKEVDATEAMTSTNSFNIGSSSTVQPFHELKKPKPDPSLEDIPKPITFIPAGSFPSLEFFPCSSSAKNKSRKKKKIQKEGEGDTRITDSVIYIG